jgi:hypothetical protein
MLWLLLTLGALSPSNSIRDLAKDKRAMKQLRSFSGLKSCNRNLVLKRRNTDGDLCRMALLASASADGRGLRKSSKDYEGATLKRAAYLVEAVEHAEKTAEKLMKAKRVPRWKLQKATRAISALCPLIDRLREEAAMAPQSAAKVRGLSSGLSSTMTARQATCRCINALRKVARPLKGSKKAYVLQADEAISLSGCVTKRLEVARSTQYVAPKRSRFSSAGRAQNVADNKRISAPNRNKAALNIVERHRSEINACAVDARKAGGNRLRRAKRMKRCICSNAKGWRFARGPKMSIEENAKPGTLVLNLSINKLGKVSACGVVVKK